MNEYFYEQFHKKKKLCNDKMKSRPSKNKAYIRTPEVKEEYKIMEAREHVLKKPGMYIGSIRSAVVDGILLAEEREGKVIITQKDQVTVNEGLERLYVEALSNAVDNVWRSKKDKVPMSYIKLSVKDDTVSVMNDGRCIPLDKHSSGPYIPEVIFGTLHSSSNYEENVNRETAGTYGIGIKAVNIFSKEFTLTINNKDSKQSYVQTWTHNMEKVGKPIIEPFTGKDSSVKITYKADLERFGLKEYSGDMIAVFQRLAMEASMYSGITVTFNDKNYQLKSLEDYTKLYTDDSFTESLYIKSEKAEVFVAPTNQFRERFHTQISFVNGIRTPDGGLHVDAWCEALFRELVDKINEKLSKELGAKKSEKTFKINITEIRKHILIFVSAKVSEPEFNSQTKAKLIGPPVEAKVSKSDIEKILKWKLIDDIVENIKLKQMAGIGVTRVKRTRIMLEGLSDANEAGKHPELCSLVLCEGLSAKTFVEEGIQQGIDGKVGHDYFGIYPLRGKLLNVRKAAIRQIKSNRVISGILEALGFNPSANYADDKEFKTLRYHRLIILTDADDDGIHIRGLILNIFHLLNPSILLRDFIFFMRTPITTIFWKGKPYEFYTSGDSLKFMAEHPESNVRYHKGLGGFKREEVGNIFGKYFGAFSYCSKLDEEIMNIKDNKKSDHSKIMKECEKEFQKNSDMMDLAFGDDTNIRKEWLKTYNPVKNVITLGKEGGLERESIADFINNELIQYSVEDCRRMIPSLVDGLKESQRKVLYVVIQENLTGKKEIKVAQLGGAIAKETLYKHGEDNLHDTIIGMAWSFVGSNNIPLMKEIGGFGSRLAGGADAASPRYIHTALQEVTQLIFRKEDEIILEHKEEEGEVIEWNYFFPIIPMFLVNGALGIAMGWSTTIPKYNPLDVIEQIKLWIKEYGDNEFFVKNGNVSCKSGELKKSIFNKMLPWFRGFTGSVEEEFDEEKHPTGRILTHGKVEKNSKGCLITELPYQTWTNSYLEKTLPDLVDKGIIKDYKNHCTPSIVNIQIVGMNECNMEELKLSSSFTLNNLVLFTPIFDENGKSLGDKITKFNSLFEMIHEYCLIRIFFYQKRRIALIEKLKRDLDKSISKRRFLDEIISGKLKVYGVEKELIETHLNKEKYYEDGEEKYTYLFALRMESYTKKSISNLEKEIETLKENIKRLEKLRPKDIWLNELEELEKMLTQK